MRVFFYYFEKQCGLCVVFLDMTSPECKEELESRTKLLRLLDEVTDALVWAISRTGLSTQQQSARLAHLLMLLSHIRHLRYYTIFNLFMCMCVVHHCEYY